MSMNDPGWGGFTPVPGADEPAAAPVTPPPPAAAPTPPAGTMHGAAAGIEEQMKARLTALKGAAKAAGAGASAGAGAGAGAKGPRQSFDLATVSQRLKTDRKLQIQAVVLAVLLVVGANAVIKRSKGPTRASYIAKMDKICAEEAAEGRALGSNYTMQQYLALAQKYQPKLEGVARPKADKAQLDNIFSIGRSMLQALQNNDGQSADQLSRQIVSADKAYGFKVCGAG